MVLVSWICEDAAAVLRMTLSSFRVESAVGIHSNLDDTLHELVIVISSVRRDDIKISIH
jgi:hypothetical protein